MAPQVVVVPGPDHQSALEVLGAMTAKATSLRAAVAFVTSSGVGLLEDLLAERSPVALQVVARGAPITEPPALIRLADLGAEVSLVVGVRAYEFHPKLWLASASDELQVLSGSGNLTEGGLRANDEQFEYVRLGAEDAALIDQHEQRFRALTQQAVPLDELRGTPFWTGRTRWRHVGNSPPRREASMISSLRMPAPISRKPSSTATSSAFMNRPRPRYESQLHVAATGRM